METCMKKLQIAKWAEHQTFRKDRGTPPWIKLHRNVFMKPKWVALSDQEKGQLISIWILAADDNGYIPADANVLRKLCQLDKAPDIKKFIELQWLIEDDNQMTTTCQPDDNQMTPQRREEKRIEKNINLVHFDLFWSAYNHKINKTKAVNAYKAIQDKVDIKLLLDKIKEYDNYLAVVGISKQHPSTWLNGRGWENDYKQLIQSSNKQPSAKPIETEAQRRARLS